MLLSVQTLFKDKGSQT